MTEITNDLSRVPLKIKMYNKINYLALGTAFLYKYNDSFHLITNGHNVTGIHPETKKYIHKEGGYPTRIIIDLPYQNTDNNQIEWVELELDLYIDDKPIWNEHPIHKKNRCSYYRFIKVRL